MRIGRWVCVWLMAGLACGRGPFERFDPAQEPPCPMTGSCERRLRLSPAIDILLVVDNSGSMGPAQALTAQGLKAVAADIEARFVASVRIGTTSTGAAQRVCDDLPLVQAELEARSCRQRPEQFFRTGAAPDVFSTACAAGCELPQLDLLATPTERDSSPRVRPWLEVGGPRANLPQGVSWEDAAGCVAPQGIDGCWIESPLESMRRVLMASEEPDADQFGFIRDDALLAVIIVTDEEDCSTRDDAIFDPSGSRHYWGDPTQATSSICWGAGVECEGDGFPFARCDPVDRDRSGNAASEDDAVLFPVDRYRKTLADIVRGKVERSGNPQLYVGGIVGVPPGYEDGAELVYRNSTDPRFMRRFGVGPGCDEGAATIDDPAIPPVRLREFGRAFEVRGRNLFSICATDFDAAFARIADGLSQAANRVCLDHCVAAQDEVPACDVTRSPESGEPSVVPPCLRGADGAWDYPLGADTCVRFAFDQNARPAPSPACRSIDGTHELIVERRSGAAASPLDVRCATTCP